jgi:hypothetical protein
MRSDRLKNAMILAAMASLFVLLCIVGTGCTTVDAPGATPAQVTLHKHLDEIIEARKGYSAAVDTAVQLHRSKLISDATFNAADDIALGARKLIDSAEDAMVKGDSIAFGRDLNAAWTQIDLAYAKHSPAKPAPSKARTK